MREDVARATKIVEMLRDVPTDVLLAVLAERGVTVTKQEPLMTNEELATVLQVSTRTIDRLLAAGKLKGYMVGGQRRFSPQHLREYLESVET